MRTAGLLAATAALGFAVQANTPASGPILISRLRAGQEIEGVILEVGFDPAAHALVVSTQMGTWRLLVPVKPAAKPPLPELLASETRRIAPGARLQIGLASAPSAPSLRSPSSARSGGAGKKAPSVLERNRHVSVHFGLSGGRILVSKPTGPADAVSAPVAWSLWDDQANQVADLGEFPAAFEIVPSPAGDTVALLSGDAVRFVSKDGTWTRPSIRGRFARGALSDGASRVMLRPADRPTVISLFSASGTVTPNEIDVGFSVRGVAIAPNGLGALVWSPEGKARQIDSSDGSMGPVFDLSPGLQAEVSDAVVDNSGRVTAGLRLSDDEGVWHARVTRARPAGIVWFREMPLREHSAALPGILVPDDELVVVWTFDEVRVFREPRRVRR